MRGDDRDAEDMALLPNDDLFVSFRAIVASAYPKAGDRALPRRGRESRFRSTKAIEAITEHPDTGDDAYPFARKEPGSLELVPVPVRQDHTVDKPIEFGSSR